MWLCTNNNFSFCNGKKVLPTFFFLSLSLVSIHYCSISRIKYDCCRYCLFNKMTGWSRKSSLLWSCRIQWLNRLWLTTFQTICFAHSFQSLPLKNVICMQNLIIIIYTCCVLLIFNGLNSNNIRSKKKTTTLHASHHEKLNDLLMWRHIEFFYHVIVKLVCLNEQ